MSNYVLKQLARKYDLKNADVQRLMNLGGAATFNQDKEISKNQLNRFMFGVSHRLYKVIPPTLFECFLLGLIQENILTDPDLTAVRTLRENDLMTYFEDEQSTTKGD